MRTTNVYLNRFVNVRPFLRDIELRNEKVASFLRDQSHRGELTRNDGKLDWSSLAEATAFGVYVRSKARSKRCSSLQ